MLADDVQIGPYSLIGENVTIGPRTVIGSHVVIEGWTTIGENCQIFHGAAIGIQPQDFKFKGMRSYVKIGDNNVIREFVTIHRGSKEEETTAIGHGNFLMAYVHVGHNCLINSHVVISNASSLAGHVEIEDKAVIGGMSGFHQFVRVGSLAMVGGYARVVKDVPPYSLVAGQPARLYGLNSIGLKRQSIPKEVQMDLKKAYRSIMQKNRIQAIEDIKAHISPGDQVNHLIRFLENPSKMGIILRAAEENEIKSGIGNYLD